MSNSGGSIKDEAIRELPASSITNVYQPLGGPFLRDAFRLVISNNTNGDLYFSTDGVTDMKKYPSVSARIMDDKTNDMFHPTGEQWYVRYDITPGSPTGWCGLEVEYV